MNEKNVQSVTISVVVGMLDTVPVPMIPQVHIENSFKYVECLA